MKNNLDIGLHRLVRSAAAFLLLAALVPAFTQSAASTPASPGSRAAPPSQSVRPAAAYAHLPLAFEENRGQTDPAARFLAHGARFSLALAPDALLLAPTPAHAAGSAATPASVRFGFVAANPTPAITSSESLPGVVNYFLGNGPAQWRTNIPTAAQVRYNDLYPGIDLTVYGTQGGQWEYDVIVAPGADPTAFGVAISGGTNVRLENGDLVIGTGKDEIRQRAPVLSQEVGGIRRPVTGGYTIRQDGSIGFVVGQYDRSLPLVIDPVTEVYGTYLGGNGDDAGNGIAVDSAGNVYVTGYTMSTNFPTRNAIQPTSGSSGSYDAFVTKINAAGTALVYSTYLGGNGSDGGYGIAVDEMGNVYITGETNSTNFPTQSPIQASNSGGFDAFVTKINAAGTALVYSSYLGGSNTDQGFAIAVDKSGNAYVTGATLGTDFPTRNPIQPSKGGGTDDAFVTEINAAGTALVYSTYLGGSGDERGNSIAVDGGGNAYVTGTTLSTDFPTHAPIQASNAGGGGDAFVTKINAAGTVLMYSTYLGGSGGDEGRGIAVDTGGNAFVTGDTTSTDFPTHTPIQASNAGGGGDAFVMKINTAGTVLMYSTYLGGSGYDIGIGIAVDSSGNAHISGVTRSTDFPTHNPIQASNAGGYDAFVTKINAAGTALVYSTYLGGSGLDQGMGIAVDTSGNAYLTGLTQSTDFPTRNLIQAIAGGGNDAYVVKVSPAGPPPPTPTGLHVTGATYNSLTWGWTNPDPTAPLIYTVDGTHFYGLAAGTTTFTLYGIAYGSYGCLTLAAYNADGTSAYTPYSCSNVVPITPYNPHFASATTSAVNFAWSNYDTLSYIAAYDGTTTHLLGVHATTYSAPTAAGYYACIAVVAYNAYYASPYSAYACGLAVPAMPTAVHVTGHTNNSVSFAWTNHDPYSGIALTNDGVHLLNEGTNATSYTQNEMTPGQYACIEIAAYNSSGASPYTSWVCGQAM